MPHVAEVPCPIGEHALPTKHNQRKKNKQEEQPRALGIHTTGRNGETKQWNYIDIGHHFLTSQKYLFHFFRKCYLLVFHSTPPTPGNPFWDRTTVVGTETLRSRVIAMSMCSAALKGARTAHARGFESKPIHQPTNESRTREKTNTFPGSGCRITTVSSKRMRHTRERREESVIFDQPRKTEATVASVKATFCGEHGARRERGVWGTLSMGILGD